MKIYVIRHGITELNKKKVVNGQIDEPLASEGIEQAEASINLLPKTIKHIYTSPFLRTTKTAEIINSKLHASISQIDELREIHMGSLAGKAWQEMEGGSELMKKHRSIQFDYAPYGGESSADVRKRVLAFLKKIHGKHADYQALIITHGGIIRVLHLLEHNSPLTDEVEHISPIKFDLSRILK